MLPVFASEGTLAGPLGFVIIGAAAFSLPVLARRIRVPAVVLEIVFGVVIGPSVLNVIKSGTIDADFIAFLAELGLLLLMFLAGFEVDFERLERQGPGPILTGLGIFGVILVSAWIGFGVLGTDSTNQRVFLTLLVSAASLGIVVPALRATNRANTALGQITLVTAVLAEFLSAAGIVVFGVWVRSGLSLELLKVPAMFAIMFVLLVLLRRAAWWYPERFERLFAAQDPDELGIRGSLSLMFIFVGLALWLDIEAILGAFMAGAMFAFVFRNTGNLEGRLSGLAYGFFIPVFFINVGIDFPLAELADFGVLGKAIALIIVAIVVKIGPALLLVFRRLSLKESVASGVLLAGQLSVIIALAELGVDLGLIDDGLEAGAILLVGVTAVLSPVVFRVLAPPVAAAEEPAEVMDA